jgi:hypothetical protein
VRSIALSALERTQPFNNPTAQSSKRWARATQVTQVDMGALDHSLLGSSVDALNCVTLRLDRLSRDLQTAFSV